MQQLAQRYKLVIQYRGTNFIGWQKQSLEATSEKRSVQGLLEQALQGMCGEECDIVTAGRTDTGVHAYANCAHVDITRRNKKTKEPVEPFPSLTVKKAANFYLKRYTTDIYVSRVEAVDPTFHARFSCLSRTYVYRIVNSNDTSGLPFVNDLCYFIREPCLDIEKMREAASLFVGQMDFAAFCSLNDKKNTVRTLYSMEIKTEPSMYSPHQTAINIYVRARAFLWHQVRKLVGGLLAVGRGSITIERLKEIIASLDPALAPPLAPACGLYFLEAEYEPYKIFDSSTTADEEFSCHNEKKRKREEEAEEEPPHKKSNTE